MTLNDLADEGLFPSDIYEKIYLGAALDDINGGMPVEAVLYKAAVELAFLMVKTYEPEFHQDAFNEVGEVIARAMNEAIRAERRGVQ